MRLVIEVSVVKKLIFRIDVLRDILYRGLVPGIVSA
jgi:hypothetical protein